MHPEHRNVLTCICRDGITDETDLRHCLSRRAAGSLYCGRCRPDDCLCGCGPCDGSDSDPGYHDPDRTEPWDSSGSEDTTSEGTPSIFTSSSSEDPEWIPARQKRCNKRNLCSGYNSKTCSDQACTHKNTSLLNHRRCPVKPVKWQGNMRAPAVITSCWSSKFMYCISCDNDQQTCCILTWSHPSVCLPNVFICKYIRFMYRCGHTLL